MARKYRFKTKPYVHQVKAVKKLIANGYGGELFMEPRTGKSKTTVDYAGALASAGKIDKVVVVAPNRVMDTWVEQFHMHCPLMFHTTIWDAKERRKGPPPTPRATYDLSVVIVNYEAFATPGKRTKSGRRSRASGRFKVRKDLQKWMGSTNKKTLMVLDESHRIASPSGSAATMIVSMRRSAAYRVILTGTPVTKAKKVHDLQMQFKFTDPTRFAHVPTADEFKNHYGRWIHDNGYPQWVGARNQPELKKLMHQSAVIVRRDDCFDLPPKDVILHSVPLVGSATAYDQMAAEMVARIFEVRKRREELKDMDPEEAKKAKVHIVEATIKLVQGLRLRQITGGCATTDEGKILRIGREKLEVTREILYDTCVDHEEKIVVAAQFRADLAGIHRLAAREFKLPTYLLRGGVSRDQATRDIRDFRELDGPAVFVVQPQSGAEGIDLSAAPNLLWYSLTPSYVKYTQMCDRIALSRKSTTFHYLLAQDTIDEVLYDTLQEDGQVAKAIMDKPEALMRDPNSELLVEALKKYGLQ
jgi:SNF2 family DNA or RNA helicase